MDWSTDSTFRAAPPCDPNKGQLLWQFLTGGAQLPAKLRKSYVTSSETIAQALRKICEKLAYC